MTHTSAARTRLLLSASLAALLQLASYWKQDSSLRAALDLLGRAAPSHWS